MIFRKYNLKKVLRNIIIIIFTVLVLNFIVTKFVYDSCFPRQDLRKVPVVPSELTDMVMSRQQIYFDSGQNRLSAYCYDSEQKSALVVLCPGYTSGADDYLWQIKSLLDCGYGVFAFDTTGSFESEGSSSVGFSQELCDLDSALDYIELNSKLGYDDIILFGHSRGGYAVACVSLFGHSADAIVTVSGVNSAMEGIMDTSVNKIGQLAYANYPTLWLYQTAIFGADTVNVCADEQLSQSNTPTLVIQGKNDEQLPSDAFSIISHKEEITNDNVEYLLWDEKNHDGHTTLLYDDYGRANTRLMEKIDEFIKQNIA